MILSEYQAQYEIAQEEYLAFYEAYLTATAQNAPKDINEPLKFAKG